MKQELSQRLIKDLENFDTISGVELQKEVVALVRRRGVLLQLDRLLFHER